MIDDNFIISKFFINGNIINGNIIKKILKENTEIENYLNNRYKDSLNTNETLWRIYKKIENLPICKNPNCNNIIHRQCRGVYAKYCSIHCYNLDPEVIINKNEKSKITKLKRYGNEYYTNSEKRWTTIKNKSLEELQAIAEKRKNTCIEKYGGIAPAASSEVKEKMKNTMMIKYNVDNAAKSEEIKNKIRNTCLDRYNSKYYLSSEARANLYKNADWVKHMVNKRNETKRKNNTFNTSKSEKACYEYIIKKYPDVIRQYKSELYPFLCDFYIPSLNLYIELNNHWTHGPHPFDPNNEEDIKLLEYWKSKNTRFYDNAIKTWTERDVNKRQTAKNNNINYLEFWTSRELFNYFTIS